MPLFFWIFVCPLVGGAIGKTRNNTGMGVMLGLLFGPLGWLLVLIDDKREQCPQCRGRVPDGAMRYLHCGATFQIPAGYEIKKAPGPGQPKADQLDAYKKWRAENPTTDLPPADGTVGK